MSCSESSLSHPGFPLILLALGFLFSGLVDALSAFQNPMASYMALSGWSAILIFLWCRAHAAQRRVKVSRATAMFAALVAIVGVPLYFFLTMPLRNAAVALLKAACFLLLVLALHRIGYSLGRFAEIIFT